MQMRLAHEYGCSSGESAIHIMLIAVLSGCDTAPEPNAVAFLLDTAVDTDAATANGFSSNTEDDQFKLYRGTSQQIKNTPSATMAAASRSTLSVSMSELKWQSVA